MQLNKCGVCGSVVNNSYGCLSASMWFKYECRMEHFVVLSWAGYDGLLWGMLFRCDVR